MRFEVQRTRQLFERGPAADRHDAPDLRLDIELFLRGGLAVLRQVEQVRL